MLNPESVVHHKPQLALATWEGVRLGIRQVPGGPQQLRVQLISSTNSPLPRDLIHCV